MLKFCIDFSICLHNYVLESDDILVFIFRFIFHQHSLCTTYLAIKCTFLGFRGEKCVWHSIAEIHNVSQMGRTERSSLASLPALAGIWKGLHGVHVAKLIGKLFLKVRSGVFIWYYEIWAAFMNDYKSYNSLQKLKIQLEMFCFQQTCNLHKIGKEMFWINNVLVYFSLVQEVFFFLSQHHAIKLLLLYTNTLASVFIFCWCIKKNVFFMYARLLCLVFKDRKLDLLPGTLP